MNNRAAYLQHGSGTGPFSTEPVSVKRGNNGGWVAFFEGKWRPIHTTPERSSITYRGYDIKILMPEMEDEDN